MVILGLMSLGFVPLVMWFLAVRHYPKSLDSEGITLKSGERLLWKDLTGTSKLVFKASSGSKYLTGLGLKFGKKQVNIAPRVLAEGPQVFPFIGRILGQDAITP